jgi:hypothetical protein
MGLREPLLELLIHIKNLLESRSCKFLIVAGYSFRDSHMQRLLWDVSHKNRDLYVIIIDPKAYQIYLDKIKYYYNDIESHLSQNRRVICLPYTFEGLLKHDLRNHYLQSLRAGLNEIEKQHQVEIHGGNADWKVAIELLINAELCEKVEDLLKNMGDKIKRNYKFYLEILLILSINYSLNGQSDKMRYYFENFKEGLYSVVQNPNVEIFEDISGDQRELRLNIYFGNYHIERIDSCDLKKLIEKFLKLCSRREQISLSPQKEFKTIREMLSDLSSYLYYFENPANAFSRYLEKRKSQPNFKAMQKNYNNYILDPSKDNCERLQATIRRVEVSIVNKMKSAK